MKFEQKKMTSASKTKVSDVFLVYYYPLIISLILIKKYQYFILLSVFTIERYIRY